MGEQSESAVEIKIDLPTLVGCFDLIDIGGGDFEAQRTSDIIGKILQTLVLGAREDKIIPTYASESDLTARLQQCLSRTLDARIDVERPQPDQSAQQLKDIIQEQLQATSIPPSPQLPLPEVLEEQDKEENKILLFENLPEGDPLVVEARGDPVKEAALAFLYSHLPMAAWGTQKAHDLWPRALKKFQERAEADNPMQTEV